ncbi:MAG: UMF1 family MFS transporter [Planctomycetota bacterium]|jgi:UMF1 family MFS transporter
MEESEPNTSTWLEKLGLHRPELRAWVLYDWANSALITTVIAAIYPVYFVKVAAAGLDPNEASFRYSLATSIALGLVAIMSPILGAIADLRACKKRLLGVFAGIGVSATACLFLVERGDWLLGMILFVVANMGASCSFVFYDSLLPHVARADEVDRVSTAGYAAGYLGGGLLLLFNLAVIQHPDWFGLDEGTLPTRLAFISVAIWWAIFTVPLLLHVKEPPANAQSDESGNALVLAIAQLKATFHELRTYRNAFWLLLAFLIYNDGIQTIYRMAAIIGADKGFETNVMIQAIVMVQFVGIPCALIFGFLASRFGTKQMILIGIAAYCGITFYGYSMETENEFFVLAALVGTVQGGCQALSRSLFASMIPKSKSGEFFALFAVGEKFAGILGPGLFALSISLSGSTETAILSILAFFIVGGLLLLKVDVKAGREAIARLENS